MAVFAIISTSNRWLGEHPLTEKAKGISHEQSTQRADLHGDNYQACSNKWKICYTKESLTLYPIKEDILRGIQKNSGLHHSHQVNPSIWSQNSSYFLLLWLQVLHFFSLCSCRFNRKTFTSLPHPTLTIPSRYRHCKRNRDKGSQHLERE